MSATERDEPGLHHLIWKMIVSYFMRCFQRMAILEREREKSHPGWKFTDEAVCCAP